MALDIPAEFLDHRIANFQALKGQATPASLIMQPTDDVVPGVRRRRARGWVPICTRDASAAGHRHLLPCAGVVSDQSSASADGVADNHIPDRGSVCLRR